MVILLHVVVLHCSILNNQAGTSNGNITEHWILNIHVFFFFGHKHDESTGRDICHDCCSVSFFFVVL